METRPKARWMRGVTPSAVVAALAMAACSPPTPASDPVATAGAQPATTPSGNATVQIPDDLAHPWFRLAEGDGASGGLPWILEFVRPAALGFAPEQMDTITAFVSGSFAIAATLDTAMCAAGATGRYSWSVSESGRVLTLSPIADDCEARSEAMTDDWIKSDCPAYPESFCLGPLDAGSHASNYFTPLVPSSAWEFSPGAMAYRVPDGWSNTYDSAWEYTLHPVPGEGETGVYMWTDVTLVSAAAPCQPRPAAARRSTSAEFAAWLRAQPTLGTSAVIPISIDGLDGLALDVAVVDGASLPCFGGVPYSPFLVHVEGTGLQWGFKAGTRNRLYFVDLGDGRTLVVQVAAEGTHLDERLREGIEIVESIELR